MSGLWMQCIFESDLLFFLFCFFFVNETSDLFTNWIVLHSIWLQQLTAHQRRKCRPTESLNHLNFHLFEMKSYYMNFYGAKTFSWKSVTSKIYSLVVRRNVSQCLTLGTTCGWVRDKRFVIFWWTIPYNDVATFCRNRKIDVNGAYKCPLFSRHLCTLISISSLSA